MVLCQTEVVVDSNTMGGVRKIIQNLTYRPSVQHQQKAFSKKFPRTFYSFHCLCLQEGYW